MTDSPATPRTQAGRRFDQEWPGSHLDRLGWRKRILAIEREAADWRERILAIEREAGSTDALRAALAEERRLVVEQIRERLPVGHQSLYDGIESEVVWRHDVDIILDEVEALAASDAGPAGIDWPLVFKAFANAVGLGIVQESQNAIAAEYARLSVLPTSDSESDDKP
jgi:hypothetical protein